MEGIREALPQPLAEETGQSNHFNTLHSQTNVTPDTTWGLSERARMRTL